MSTESETPCPVTSPVHGYTCRMTGPHRYHQDDEGHSWWQVNDDSDERDEANR
jgi:hypothetical protein